MCVHCVRKARDSETIFGLGRQALNNIFGKKFWTTFHKINSQLFGQAGVGTCCLPKYLFENLLYEMWPKNYFQTFCLILAYPNQKWFRRPCIKQKFWAKSHLFFNILFSLGLQLLTRRDMQVVYISSFDIWATYIPTYSASPLCILNSHA